MAANLLDRALLVNTWKPKLKALSDAVWIHIPSPGLKSEYPFSSTKKKKKRNTLAELKNKTVWSVVTILCLLKSGTDIMCIF